ncbi:putative Ig domain-containing protein [Litoribrevibacter euphylliae]|uniref:Ig domain-containing protein n=1 Tax=Litoribrevibacter euphylliae TaxID=1834034 RepID=A0ABV7HEG9_9GAMM
MKKILFSSIKYPLVWGMCTSLAHAVVTYNGTDGVLANIFNSNSVQVCTGCHNSALVGAVARSSAPDGVNFDNYAEATATVADLDSSGMIDGDDANHVRASFRVNAGTMPPNGALNASEKSLIAQWVSDGGLEHAAPAVTTSAASSVSKYQATFNGSVFENGANTTMTFAYGLSSMSLTSNKSASSPSGTGGGTSSGAVSATQTGLDCGTTYYFRLEGTNSEGSDNGSTLNFTTSDCNVGPTITSTADTAATEDQQYSYQLTITDPDDSNNGTDLTFSLTNEPAGMSVSTTGLVTWTPTEGVTTSGSVTVTVEDGGEDGATGDSEIFTVSVTAVNDSPSITSTAGTAAMEDQQYSYQLTVSDPDDSNNGTDLTFSLSNEPAGMTVSSTGLVTWTPTEGVSTSGAVTVTVQDGGENGATSDSEIFTVSVTSVNDSPVISSTAGTSASEDVEYSYQVDVTDPDDSNNGTDLSFSLSNQPTGMTISSTGLITWTATEGITTSGQVTVSVEDGGEDGATSDSEQFTVTVTAVNDAPSITSSPSTSAIEAVLYSYQVTISDPDDTNNGTDISFSLANEPSGMTVSSTGLVTWTPGDNTTTSGVVTVIAADGGEDGAAAATQDWTIAVDSVNDPPVITSSAGTTATEDVEYSYQVAVDDPDDQNNGIDLSFDLTNAPTGMTVSATGLISWTPTHGITSSGEVTLIVSDGGESDAQPDTELFTVSVTAVNDAPVVTSTAVTTATEDIAYEYDVDATDEEGDAISFSLTTAPTGMTIDSDTGLIAWTPTEGITSENVDVRVSDGTSQVSHSFTVLVTPVNETPVISSTPGTDATEDESYQYQVMATDPEGDPLLYLFSQAPEGMTVSVDGLIEWVPENGITSASVALVVTDGEFNAEQSFSISVTPVNDAVELTNPGIQSLVELTPWQLQLAVTDVDDDNDGDSITFELLTAPTGLTISNTGVLAWTPEAESAGSYTSTLRVADGLEDGVSARILTLILNVALLDSDEDTVADYDDNCPNIANLDQLDTDLDDLGDVCDSDDDNDGIPDIIETANDLDPLDADDAVLDLDNDGLTNLQESEICVSQQDDICETIAIDNVAPVISLETPLVINAVNFITQLDLDVSARDANDGIVTVTLIEGETALRPGAYELVWQASDEAGNTATVTQSIQLKPALIFGGSRVSGEGNSFEIPLTLSGNATAYPVTVSLATSGSTSSSDFTLAATQVEIDESNAATVAVTINPDQITESDETLTLSVSSISDGAYFGSVSAYKVLIVDRNVAPQLSVTIRQNGLTASQVYQDGGEVTISATASDANNDDLTLTWDVEAIAGALTAGVAEVQESRSFDPQQLTAGELYDVSVSVSDEILNSELSVSFLVGSTSPTLDAATDSDGDGIDDLTEGLADSDGDGVPDYQDAINDATRLSAGTSGSEATNLMAVESGLQMSMGRTALRKGQGGAFVRAQDMTDGEGNVVTDGDYSVVGGLYDFVVKGLTEANRVARIVIPLAQSVPSDASYRKFSQGQWFEFIENSTDFIESANRVDGVCPAPGDEAYQTGLLRFADCVQLNISDGGPNDADGVANGVIEDPSGVSAIPASSSEVSLSAPDDQPSGSGGVFGFWAILGLLSLLVIRLLAINRFRSQG